MLRRNAGAARSITQAPEISHPPPMSFPSDNHAIAKCNSSVFHAKRVTSFGGEMGPSALDVQHALECFFGMGE